MRFDQIDAGDCLGDGVLDLETGVRLDEGDPGRRIGRRGIDQELERAGIAIACR